MTQALQGIKIVDLTRYLPGSFATMFLADLGADVIMVEQPEKGEPGRSNAPYIEGISARHLMLQRNKRSLTLNLNSEEGRKVFLNLVKDADVVLENFRPGYLKERSLDYEQVSKINAGIIYCSLSGFGHSGPKKDLAGHDLNYMGWAGILGLSGTKDGEPALPGIQMADMTGSMMAQIGILAALIAKNRTGRGQYIDVAFLDSAISLLPLIAAPYFAEGKSYQAGEHLYTGSMAWYNVYETLDHRYITLGSLEKKFWNVLCDTLDMPDYKKRQFDPTCQEEIKSKLRNQFLTKTLSEWMQILQPLNICSGPVLTMEEVFTDPNTVAREMVYTTEHPYAGTVYQIGCPIKFSETPAQYYRAAPGLGEHTQEILTSLGYCSEEIEQMRQNGII